MTEALQQAMNYEHKRSINMFKQRR